MIGLPTATMSELTIEHLVLATTGLETYVLSFYPGVKEDGMLELLLLPTGVFLAIPTGPIPDEGLEDAGESHPRFWAMG